MVAATCKGIRQPSGGIVANMAQMAKFWLVKTEPESFSIHDLAAAPGQTTCWDGVRNYQARNYMREMRLGERVLVYHSSVDPPSVVGTARVARESYPDPTAWDKRDPHFDPQSTADNPRWFMVDLKLEQVFKRQLPLDELRGLAALNEMELLRKGSRLSVQPVRKSEFEAILKLAGAR
jgi:predicted RNA-binding protein with PUA-like domain